MRLSKHSERFFSKFQNYAVAALTGSQQLLLRPSAARLLSELPGALAAKYLAAGRPALFLDTSHSL
jgi:hypothetical protein